MRLSSVYLYEKIEEKYEILEKGNLSGSDGYLRPFLCCVKKDVFRKNHVYVVQGGNAEEWESAVLVVEDIFWVFCGQGNMETELEEF